MKRLYTVLGLSVVGVLSLVAAAPPTTAVTSSAVPTMTVSPSHHLAGGDTVTVKASGITPSATVRVNECATFDNQPDDDCPDLTTTTADVNGDVSVPVTLNDPVYDNQEIGDAVPVYCRSDVCQVFLSWTATDGSTQVLASGPLEFSGAPARIHVRPAGNLYARQMVTVNGSAYGAAHAKVLVLEETCYDIAQGSGCYGALPAVHTRVLANGTFQVQYEARRYLADGTDCGDPDSFIGTCEITVEVLGANGTPDDSFGVPAIGQPAATISFRF
jgi:hypothetical protein